MYSDQQNCSTGQRGDQKTFQYSPQEFHYCTHKNIKCQFLTKFSPASEINVEFYCLQIDLLVEKVIMCIYGIIPLFQNGNVVLCIILIQYCSFNSSTALSHLVSAL